MAHRALQTRHRVVALIGNPNTGKSTLFVALSGVRQHVANYPGATVEKKVGTVSLGACRWSLIDLPGTYSLAPRSLDEMVTVDVLLGHRPDVEPLDVVLCVLDASNLARNLYLLSQVLELGRPTVVALTMMDVAESRGTAIDVKALEARLGVPVVPVQANRGLGLVELRQAVEKAADLPAPVCPRIFPSVFQQQAQNLEAAFADTATAGNTSSEIPVRYLIERLILDRGGFLETTMLQKRPPRVAEALKAARESLESASCPVPAVETSARYQWAQDTLRGITTSKPTKQGSLGDKLDNVLTHPFWGMVILALILLTMFQSIFKWASVPMDWIESGVSTLGALVENAMSEGSLRSLLVEGVIGGVGSVIVFLPQIMILFFFLAVLEDCGYLARAAYLMDRTMARFGLSGKSFIPLLSSFACAIPGVMAARVIDDRRDRLVTILVAPLMSCSARLPVYALLTAAFVPNRPVLGPFLGLQGLTFFGLYALGIVTAAGAAWLMKRTLFQGGSTSFVMELPPYRRPSLKVVFNRVVERAWIFLQGAGTLILAVSILMWAALYFPRLPDSITRPIQEKKASLELQAAAAGQAGDSALAQAYQVEIEQLDASMAGEQSRRSLLGRIGRLIEPVVRPLGWDWRIGSAALASFPAREVIVASLAVIFDAGPEETDRADAGRLREALKSATWPDSGQPLFTPAVALSLMVFCALCAQCVSTLAVIRRETNSWRWPAFSFAYMTILAYLGAFLTYQIGSRIG